MKFSGCIAILPSVPLPHTAILHCHFAARLEMIKYQMCSQIKTDTLQDVYELLKHLKVYDSDLVQLEDNL